MALEVEDDDSIEQCCCGNDPKEQRCMCLPYDDPYIITAQIMSLVAFVLSWLWWATFFIGGIALALFQVNWCCRRSRVGLIAALVISIATALLCIYSGIFVLIEWKNAISCYPFRFESDDDDDYYTDYCEEQIYAIVAFVDAALWLATAGYTIKFVTSGRYAKWEAIYNKTNDNNNNDDDDKKEEAEEEAGAEPTAAALEEGNVQSSSEAPNEGTDDAAPAASADISPEDSKAGEETPKNAEVAIETTKKKTEPDVEEV